MIRIAAFITIAGLGLGGALAQVPKEPKADCSMFKRTSDGRWVSTINSKVGNPKSFVTLQAGRPIERDLTVVGINVSDTIDRLCGGK